MSETSLSLGARLRRLAGLGRNGAETDALVKLERTLARLDKRLDLLTRAHRDDRLVLQRLVRLLDRRGTADDDATGTTTVAPPVAPSAPDEWRHLHACPLCGHEAATLVCEYNRFLLADTAPDDSAKIYNYSLCHGCGVVYAARRPAGPRYRQLLSSFHENLGRVGAMTAWLNPAPLNEADRAHIRNRARAGALVSEHASVSDRDWIPGAFRDRLVVAQHVELIGSLVTLDKPRVLEIRSRTGALLDAFRRLYGASVYALPIFESQQELVKSLYGIPADALVDFERFRIPYDGPFDLIVSNHMLTHSLAPGEFLDTISEALAPGGHLYLYNEMDEGEYLGTSRSMFQAMNPFHMQLFNADTLQRALAARGFETVFLAHSDRIHLMCLARKAEPVAAIMPERERKRRLRQYAASRDVSIVAVPEERRGLFGGEWDQIVERAVVSGAATLDERGRVQVSRVRRKGGEPEAYDEGNA